jgi:hypothetical protein
MGSAALQPPRKGLIMGLSASGSKSIWADSLASLLPRLGLPFQFQRGWAMDRLLVEDQTGEGLLVIQGPDLFDDEEGCLGIKGCCWRDWMIWKGKWFGVIGAQSKMVNTGCAIMGWSVAKHWGNSLL